MKPKGSLAAGLAVVLCVLGTSAFGESANERTALQDRVIQSKKYVGLSESQILSATVNVLQDMGYQVDDSEAALGIITASKTNSIDDQLGLEAKALEWRDSLPNKELTDEDCGAPFASILTGQFFSKLVDSFHCSTIRDLAPIARRQIIRVSVAINKSSNSLHAKESTSETWIVRVNFQTSYIAPRKAGEEAQEFDAKAIKDPVLYQGFFNKLSKSVFIEAQDL